jgi:hypothetical protein
MCCDRGKAGSKRVFYVTNEDDPMEDKKGKTEQQRLALEKVRVRHCLSPFRDVIWKLTRATLCRA